MKTLSSFLLIGAILATSSMNYSTTAAVALVGAKISVSQKANVPTKKYKRKDCPVCKGNGWYLSGDGIAKINCQYCEP